MPSNPKDYYPPMHSAEHILNQTMVLMFKTERSFSNHIERKKSKCDYHFDRNLEEAEIISLENQVNNVINSKMDIEETILSIEEAKRIIDFNRLPNNFGNEIRLIKIGDYDTCPC